MKILSVSAALLSLALAAPALAQSSTAGNSTTGAGSMGTDTTATHGSQTMGQTDMNASSGDVKSLLTQLVQANQGEIEMGKLALTNAKSKTVKDFAKKLVADHTAAAEKVKPIAIAQGVDMSSIGSMSGMSGNNMSGSVNGTMSGSGANVNGSVNANGNDANASTSTPSGDMSSSSTASASSSSGMNADMTKLQGLKGSEFDREFASMMVDGHQQALSLLDQIKTAANGNAQVTKMVGELKPTIQKHLTAAKALVKAVGSPRHDTRGTDMNNNGAQNTPDQNQNGTTTH